LTLARAIVVEKHGGTLTFETEVGKGTTFYVRLPVNGVQEPREAVAK
jgi:signal transduction histidine kinase